MACLLAKGNMYIKAGHVKRCKEEITRSQRYQPVMIRHFVLLALCCLLGHQAILGQELPVQWHVAEAVPRSIDLPELLAAESVTDTCQIILSQLRELAYLEASIDSVQLDPDRIHIDLHLGRPYTWSYLDLSEVPSLFRESIRLSDYRERKVSHREIQALFEQMLVVAEGAGYPFAAVRLRDVQVEAAQVAAKVEVRLNDRVTIERIRVEGNLKLSDRFLSHMLEIEPGDPFNKSKILRAEQKLRALGFVKIKQDPTVEFLGNGATLNFYLDKQNANRFDVLLGLIPSSVDNERFQLTGNVNVDMRNSFGAGEHLHLNFERLRPATQELELAFNYPFPFNWPFGIDFKFDLFKLESQFIDIGYEIGLQYYLQGRNYISFFVANDNHSLLTIDSLRILQTRTLPDALDVRQSLFGTQYVVEKLNYRLNPRQGWLLDVKASAGTRKIRKNNTITALQLEEEPTFDFGSLYDDLDLNSFKYVLSLKADFYVPIFQNSTLKFATSSGWVQAGDDLYQNELLRIGGTKILRGFNEESIFASLYSVFTTEYRLLFNQNSNLFVFADFGYYRQSTDRTQVEDYPIGFGTGLNLQTKVGVFGISYAVGGRRSAPLRFSAAKIHFGMVTQF